MSAHRPAGVAQARERRRRRCQCARRRSFGFCIRIRKEPKPSACTIPRATSSHSPRSTSSGRRRLSRTTSSTAHYLAAAADGRFAQREHQLVAGLEHREAARAAATAATRWGATSGLDLLTGLLAAAAPLPTEIRKTA